MYIYRNTS